MTWGSGDSTHAEARLRKRDSAALYDTLDALYLSPVDAFDELASTYDQRLAGHPVLQVEEAAVLAALPDLSGKRVADIGCGTGRYALQLARLDVESVTGIDLSHEMLTVARRKARRSGEREAAIQWQQGDLLTAIPLLESSQDLIVCALTFSFLPEITGALQLLTNALAMGGTLLISDYHPHGLTQARAEATAKNGNKDKAPHLRFTSASGDDCRVVQYIHPISELWSIARSVGLTLESLLEPVPDRHTANTHPALRDQYGVPQALIALFRKD